MYNTESYAAALKLLVKNCEYPQPLVAVRDQLILNLANNISREKILDKA